MVDVVIFLPGFETCKFFNRVDFLIVLQYVVYTLIFIDSIVGNQTRWFILVEILWLVVNFKL